MNATYTHVWRASDTDYPCSLADEEEWVGKDGQVFVRIVRADGATGVPKEQLIPIDIWEAEQNAAVQKSPPIPNGCFTVIQASNPPQVGKTYRLDKNKRLAKTSVASIIAGVATTIDATEENLVDALKQTTQSTNQVIMLDAFIGATPGSPAEISIVTEAELERLIGGPISGASDTGFYMVKGKATAARLKRATKASGWILFDSDTPEGMPAEWARLPLAERLRLLEPILPGISTCLRIEYRGSSARILNGSGKLKPGPSHALIQIGDPSMLDLLRAHVHVQSVLHDLSFKSPRHSRADPSRVIGHAHLTLFDLGVWILGRLIFNAVPDVTDAPGYTVLDADPQIVNPKGGVLDISWLRPPSAEQARAYRLKTGRAVDFSGAGTRGGFAVREDGQLQLTTEIEARGVVRPLGDWLVEMLNDDTLKLRCETPFRASVSEAAFIQITASGNVLVHDSGTAISSYLAPLPQTTEEASRTAKTIDEYEMTEAVLAARARRTQRQAEAAFPDPPPVTDDDDENTDDENADASPVDLWKAIDAPELPLGLLPPRVEQFVLANAKALGADGGGLAGASIAALAVAIPDGVKLQVQAKGRKWQIAARIWVALVGDPSTKKTPIIKAALAALERHDHRRRQEYAFLKSLWDAQTKREKAEALAAGRKPPDHNRLIIGDITAEAAGEIIMTSPNGVLAWHDELSGFFAQMERYNPKGSDRTFWLQARNGGPFSVDRITRGSNYISNLSVTLLGGIQPEPMRKVAAGASDDGLIQRLTPIMLRPAEMTDDDVDTQEADKDFADLVDTLLNLSPSVLKFDAGAQTIRRDLEFEHHECVRSWEPINKKLSSAFGKQDGYFAELCLIWHCAENAGQDPLPEVVTEDTARRAAEFMRTFLRPHLVAFYAGLLDLSDEHDRLKAIAGYILAHKPKRLNSREVQKAVRSMRKLLAREVTAIMEQLEAFGWLFRHPPPRYGALPVWKINPAVHVQFEERAKEETVRRARDRAVIIKGATAQSVSR